MKNKYSRLLKNTSIFAIGTFCSKILVFLIVPLYTHILSTSDYGKIDLITSTINLLVPFSTLLIYEAAIRFLVGKESNEKNVLNNCILIFVVGSIISVCISPIILTWLDLNYYWPLFSCLLVLTNYTTIFGQYLRATGRNSQFAISGVINTLSVVTFNLIFLLVFKKGIEGYLYSLIIAHLITGIYIFIKSRTTKFLNLKQIDFCILKKMLKYSIPLVPNNLMWWIMNAGDKYVINYFLSTSANGVFSISYKIPTILTMVFSIFMQAWQVSAIEERTDRTRNAFYKKVFDCVSLLLILITALIIIFVKPAFEIVMGDGFVDSWFYVPLLCVANMFNCFATFAGVVYITEKKSKRSFVTTFIGAVANLIFNFVLIRQLGLVGVAIGTALGYLLVMFLRFKDFKKFFKTTLGDCKILLSVLALIAESIAYMYIDGAGKYIVSTVFLLTICIISRKKILDILKSTKTALLKRKKSNQLKP